MANSFKSFSISSLISWLSFMGVTSSTVMMTFSDILHKSVSLIDPLSCSLIWLTGGIVSLSFFSSEKSKVMSSLWWSLSTILLLSFLSFSLFKFYVLFELSLIPILLMILSFGGQPERLSAGAYLLFYTTIISVPYLAVILSLDLFSCNFFSSSSGIHGGSFFSFLFMTPFMIKMPIFGLHFWLPKAHVEANTAGSMVLAGLLLKLGSYGAFRTTSVLVFSKITSWLLVFWLSSAIMSSLITFMQVDIKKLVAYSSVTHMTFLMVALMTNSKVMMISTILLSLSHGWVASGLFWMVGTLSHAAGSRAGYLMASESGLNWLFILFGVLLVSNASVPPFPSFYSEIFLVFNILSSGMYLVVMFMFLSISVCYYNAFSFILLSHMKPSSVLMGALKLVQASCLLIVALMSLITLIWMTLF